MSNTTLVIMAAGIGSRYGGVKQADSFGPSGEWLMDYAIYDAQQAGFNDVVIITRKDLLEDMQAHVRPGDFGDQRTGKKSFRSD